MYRGCFLEALIGSRLLLDYARHYMSMLPRIYFEYYFSWYMYIPANASIPCNSLAKGGGHVP